MKHMLLLLAAIIPLLFAGCGSSEDIHLDTEVRTFTAEPFVYEYKNSLGEVLISTPYTPVLLTCIHDKSANYKGYQYSYKEKDSSGETLHTVTGTFELGGINNTFLSLSGIDGARIVYELKDGVWVILSRGGLLSGASKPYPPAFYEVKTDNK